LNIVAYNAERGTPDAQRRQVRGGIAGLPWAHRVLPFFQDQNGRLSRYARGRSEQIMIGGEVAEDANPNPGEPVEPSNERF
jgi:hypothetical protein